MNTSSRKTDLVRPITGTAGSGNCLIGPYRPMGLVKLGPDTSVPQPTGGYQSGEPIVRFSHMHVSGTGGPPRYGHVGLTPFTGEPGRRTLPPYIRAPLERIKDAYPRNEQASVGYYAIDMMPWEVRCELTSTKHVGVHRYTFPQGQEAKILLDAGAHLNGGAARSGTGELPQDWDSETGQIGGWMQLVSNREIIGKSDFRGGWGHDKAYSVYFYLQSDVPFADQPLIASDGGMAASSVEGSDVSGTGIRCVLSYPDAEVVQLRVGISFVSIANAREYVEKEAAQTFDEIHEQSVNEWEDLFSAYRIEGGTSEQQHMFYTMLYRLYCMPTDLGVDQENPYWKSGVRQFTDYYCLWDSIRNANSFFHLFDPNLSRDFMNSLLDIADHTGWLPDAHIANQHAYMQSACACDILFSEAARKGITGVDYSKALRFMRKNNEHKTPDVNIKGRYIEDYNQLGYLSTDISKGSVSRFLEYTYHDWCISRLAELVGDHETADRYRMQADRVWNLWNAEAGTFFPRNPDGTWLTGYEPWTTPSEGWNDPSCYEGSTAVWSLNVFHDLPGLIDRKGGKEAFIGILDRIFREHFFEVKETRMHIPHLYTYAGRPDLAAEKVLASLALFRPLADGLPDNEDFGVQSGYYLWQSMGLYPIYGQTHYMLTPPLFDRIDAEMGHSGRLVITAERQGKGAYIQACYLGETAIDRAWVTHEELVANGKLHFVLGDQPCGFGETMLPPSDY